MVPISDTWGWMSNDPEVVVLDFFILDRIIALILVNEVDVICLKKLTKIDTSLETTELDHPIQENIQISRSSMWLLSKKS